MQTRSIFLIACFQFRPQFILEEKYIGKKNECWEVAN